jgi:hypothetical protein
MSKRKISNILAISIKKRIKKVKIDYNDWISATGIKNYILNDKYIDILEKHKNVRTSNNESNIFQNKLFSDGIKFEDIVINKLRKEHNVYDICTSRYDYKDMNKYDDTINAIKNKKEIIYQGLLYNFNNKTYGIPDLLIRSDIINKIFKIPILSNSDIKKYSDILKKKDTYYIVVDIKHSSIKINETGHIYNNNMMLCNKGQLFIYNMALSNIIDNGISASYILGKLYKIKDGKQFIERNNCFYTLGKIDYDDFDSDVEDLVSQSLNWKRNVNNNKVDHNIFYPNMSNKYDMKYRKYKHNYADNIKEITQIWNCGYKNREEAHKNNVYSWDDKNCTSDILGIKGNWTKARVQAILDINQQNKKMYDCKNLLNTQKWLNTDKFEIYIDFETANVVNRSNNDNGIHSYNEQFIVIIGCGWIENDIWNFKNFVIKKLTKTEEKYIINKFYNWLIKMKNKHNLIKLPKLIHWGNFERSMFNNVKKKHEKSRWNIIENDWLDFCKIMKNEMIVVKNATKYGLKNVANAMYNNKLIESKWDTTCKSGEDAMTVFINNKDNISDIPDLKDIEKYNELDCKIMYEIILFFRTVLRK